MWYFAWVLGVGFAILLAILNTLWGEYEESRNPATPIEDTPASKRNGDDARPH